MGGPRIFIKRDDLTGHAFGGNKSRYLEFTLADALEQGADAVVLSAVVQSNHCRQFAAAAAKHGLKAVVVLREDESPMGYKGVPTGNYLLDHLFGAEVCTAPSQRLEEVIAAELDRLRQQGYNPVRVSGRRSSVSYILCALELTEQCRDAGVELGHVFIPSGGTSLAGLVAGFALLAQGANFVGLPQGNVKDPKEAAVRVAQAAQQVAGSIGLECIVDPQQIQVEDRYVGPGFGQMDQRTKDAIHLLGRTEGIVVDPTYSGKAFAGLVDYINRGWVEADKDAVFVHTGGTPLVFVYGEQLL